MQVPHEVQVALGKGAEAPRIEYPPVLRRRLQRADLRRSVAAESPADVRGVVYRRSPMATKASSELTLHDRLSRLGYQQACKLLGDQGPGLIQAGGRWDIDVDEQVSLTTQRFELRLPLRNGHPAAEAVVTIDLEDDRRDRLAWRCSGCRAACEHVGAALSVILEEKLTLGLAAAPPERIPVESLGEDDLVKQAVHDRLERARTEKMRLSSKEPDRPWTDYTIRNAESGRSYRIALRGEDRGESYCSCPDFRTNTLGTCKHILYALDKVRREFPAAKRRRPYVRKDVSVHVLYGREAELRLKIPERLSPAAARLVAPFMGRAIVRVRDLVRCVAEVEKLGQGVTVYPDAEELIAKRLFLERIATKVAEIRANPASHPLRRELLRTELLPYQLDGVAFAVGAGRAVLADDMGLGKTIQGIGVAELLAREAGIRKVLIICPASVKAQWNAEIERFSTRSSKVVIGSARSRAQEYRDDVFFTVCNYEQVVRDIQAIERTAWGLIILDEGQRIKNWEAKTTAVVKALRSPFALVLSGTPLENRLDELHSVVAFIDDRRLGPAFRFLNRHRVVDEKGKVLGYKNLAELRQRLVPVLLRRTRAQVMQELPPRTTEILRIAPTDEQLELHDAHLRIVASIVRKRYMSEMDLLRLRKELLMCRMAANGTYLVDKQAPGYSSKLRALDDLLGRLFQEEGRKVVLFSEWTTMLDLVEPLLTARGLRHVRLDGSVPQKQRQQLVNMFQHDPQCQIFITTNAGSTGLNLQAANTVVNVDLPWNPAVLEQRVGRAHRMGQRRPVQVFVLVTEGTLEENLLATLSAKHELSLAALDVDSDIDAVDLASGIEELKRRLELLLGAKPEAPGDESVLQRREDELARFSSQRDRIGAAGGQLVAAAVSFLEALLPVEPETPQARQMSALVREHLSRSLRSDAEGRPQLTLTLPGGRTLDVLASALGRVLSRSTTQPGPN